MSTTSNRLAAAAVIAAVLTLAPRFAVAQEDHWRFDPRWFAGVDVGVMQPINAMDRYVQTGGAIAPFVGFKFFQDADLTPNLGLMLQPQFIGGGAEPCFGCVRGHNNKDTYAIGYTGGPRASLPIGPLEAYATFQAGGISGLNSPAAIGKTSWGFSTGGGLNYVLNDNWMLGAWARYNWWDQEVNDVGEARYVTTGVGLTWQEAPPPPPAPPPPAPPPPPPAPMKKKLILRGVNFDFDKSNIRPDAVPILEQACKTLKEEAAITVSCDGHTDSIGTEKYNIGLSKRRANSVRDWLVKCGIPASRLSTRGFGEANPVASNKTAEGRAQNRRTELVITNQ
jgi:outer membrane protein OmpA-like peptidoglycan-associated protein